MGVRDTGSARKEDLSGAGRDARTAQEGCAWSPSAWQALRLLICEMGALTLDPEAGSPAGAAEAHLRPQFGAVAGAMSVPMAFNY